MIQITLTFNSIDAARRAMLELPESLLATSTLPGEDKPVVVKETPAKKPAKQEAAATQHTAEASAAPEQKAECSAPAVEYATLQKAVFALAGKSREAAAAVAASFGVKTFKELAADKWADALAAVQAKTAEIEAA